MHLLVTGGTGLVGWRLVANAVAAGHTVTYTYLTSERKRDDAEARRLDVRDREATIDLVTELAPDAIIHSAAMTDVDACERCPADATAVNVEGTRNILNGAERADCQVQYLSTTFVFDGEAAQHDESSPTNPVNHYGRTKEQAEEVVRDAAVDTVIARTDQPYCWPEPWQNESMVSWTVSQLDEGEPFAIFDDWYNMPVFVDDLVGALLTLLDGHTGTYHVVGPEYISRYEWACTIADVFGYDPELIERGSAVDADLPAARPNANVSNRKIRTEAGVSFRSIGDALTAIGDRIYR